MEAVLEVYEFLFLFLLLSLCNLLHRYVTQYPYLILISKSNVLKYIKSNAF